MLIAQKHSSRHPRVAARWRIELEVDALVA
jgi:hypothetical protein